MRLKKNRAERNRELLDGIERAPEAFAQVAASARRLAEAFRRVAADMRHWREFRKCFSHLRSSHDGKR